MKTISTIPSIHQFFERGVDEHDTHINSHICGLKNVLMDALYLRNYECATRDKMDRINSIIDNCSATYFALIGLETDSIQEQIKATN